MKCPNCKKEMREMRDKEVDLQEIPNDFVCFNYECIFYGLKRINKEWFEDMYDES